MNRRKFLTNSGKLLSGISLMGAMPANPFIDKYQNQRKGPEDYIIVQGHYDIWEFNDRLALRDESQNSPLKDFLLPRLLEAGIDVVIMPAGGAAARHRMENDQKLEGSIRTTDMLLREIEKTEGKASVILSKRDIPEKPDPNHVKFFFDFEGGDPITNDAIPGLPEDQRLALLRNFFRQGVRGMQLTYDSRNIIGDGHLEGKGARLSEFGVEVVKEMNRLGMMIGVSHVSENTLFHAAEISTKPIVSTHQNPREFIQTSKQLSDEMIKAVASTGGIIGIRYHSNESTPYDKLVEMIEYIADLVGIEHTGFAWLGHDIGHPRPGYVPGYSSGPAPTGIEAMTKLQQFVLFIEALNERFNEDEIALILGGNFLRIWKEILPD